MADTTQPFVVQHQTEDGPDLTSRGLAALDLLADVLVHDMARTPAGIARTLDEVMHAPLGDLRRALAELDQKPQSRRP